MPFPARVKASPAQWAIVAVLLLLIVYAPAVVASSVTAPAEPVRFYSEPWEGWAFSGKVLVESFSADAASPGAALELAGRHWGTRGDAAGPAPTAAKLLYLPGRTEVELKTLTQDGDGAARVDPKGELVWQVTGKYPDSDAEGVIGLLDFASGKVVWDVRTSTGKDAA